MFVHSIKKISYILVYCKRIMTKYIGNFTNKNLQNGTEKCVKNFWSTINCRMPLKYLKCNGCSSFFPGSHSLTATKSSTHNLMRYSIKCHFLALLAQENGQLRSSDHAKSGCGQRNAIEFKRGILHSTIKIFRINL